MRTTRAMLTSGIPLNPEDLIMTVKIENGMLIIQAPIGNPEPSKSGKSMNVVSTGGFIPTTAQVDGKPVRINLNAIIKL